MKRRKKVTIPAKPAEARYELDAFVCDLCGAEASNEAQYKDVGNWADDPYWCFTYVQIETHDGSSYPEGGSDEIARWDVCPKCFNEKIRPHLPAPRREEKEW